MLLFHIVYTGRHSLSCPSADSRAELVRLLERSGSIEPDPVKPIAHAVVHISEVRDSPEPVVVNLLRIRNQFPSWRAESIPGLFFLCGVEYIVYTVQYYILRI
jgi:hypothetical protein